MYRGGARTFRLNFEHCLKTQSAYRPSRALRNLCRIFSRQLVLQEVFRSRDIAMAFLNVFTHTDENKAAVVPACTDKGGVARDLQ